MTKKDIASKVAKLQQAFALQCWRIGLDAVDTGKLIGDRAACIDWQSKTLEATISVATQRASDEIEYSLLHEIVHLCQVEMVEVFSKLLLRLPEDTAKLAYDMIDEATEITTVRIARGIRMLTGKATEND